MFHPYSSQSLLTRQQMRAAEQHARDSGVSERQMIETAGANAAHEIAQLMQQQALDGDISVVCGPGNNGADGMVAALHLHRNGYALRVFLSSDSRQSPENDYFWRLLRAELPEYCCRVGLASADLDYSAVLVDALFGIGLTRAFDADLSEFAERYNAIDCTKVALDIASGVDADSGAVLGSVHANDHQRCALRADITYAFFRGQRGQLLLPGRDVGGRWQILDCGIDAAALQSDPPTLWRNDPELWRDNLALPTVDAHKYQRAPVYLEVGADFAGAASLVAAGAQALGASYLALTPTAGDQGLANPAWVQLAQPAQRSGDLRKYRALAVGCGCQPSDRLRQRIARLLASRIPCVLDAGALSAFAADPHILFELLHSEVVLTPHFGEFRQLFPALASGVPDRWQACATAARLAGCTVLLKGPDSVVAANDGRGVINANARSTLASAGSGDVLSGGIAALMAQGFSSFAATSAAVWIHGASSQQIHSNSSADQLAPAMASVYRSLLPEA